MPIEAPNLSNVPPSTPASSSDAPTNDATAAPSTDLLSWLPSAYRQKEKSPTFVHQGEKVVALPDDKETETATAEAGL